MQSSARIRQWFGYPDLNYEQYSTNLYQEHEFLMKTRLVLITGSRNKTWVQLILTRMRDNVPWLSIYTLDNYSTLLAAQAIFIVVAWASSYLTCTPSYLKTMPYGPRNGLSLKSLGLYSKSTWLVLQVIQRRYFVPQGTTTALL
jgi:hypothetical protein